MPLTERDVNIPAEGRESKDCVTSLPLQKCARKTHSRLPVLRTPMPNTAPPVAKWFSGLHDRDAGSENKVNRSPVATTSQTRLVAMSPRQDQSAFHAINNTLPTDKPLPARPIAHLSTALSPSKDGRSLIDAIEHPLHMMSVTGSAHEWPSLKPQPCTSTSSALSPIPSDESVGGTPHWPGLSKEQDATEDASVSPSSPIDDCEARSVQNKAKAVSHSQSLALLMNNAKERSNQSLLSGVPGCTPLGRSASSPPKLLHTSSTSALIDTTTSTTQQSEDDHNGAATFAGDAMLHRKVITPKAAHTQKAIIPAAVSHSDVASSLPVDHRVHSPCEASFSRPRPGSMTSTPGRSKMKTASRIPIYENKSGKPTLVHVKERRTSNALGITTEDVASPSYGTRKLDAPNALQILDQGVKRRQLQRNLPKWDSPQLRHAPTFESIRSNLRTPTLTRSHTSSSNLTRDQYSPEPSTAARTESDEDDLITPQDHIFSGPYSDAKLSVDHHDQEVPSYYFARDIATTKDTQPPSASPFTAPLATIPSEATLDAESMASQSDAVDVEVTRALSQLEGRGGPPRCVDVDERTLLRMFGRLKQGFAKSEQSSFTEKANVAEKYLAMRDSDGVTCDKEPLIFPRQRESVANTEDALHSRHGESTCEQVVLSKWSSTTPSDNALSPASADLALTQRMDDLAGPAGFLHSVPEVSPSPTISTLPDPPATMGSVRRKLIPLSTSCTAFPSQITTRSPGCPEPCETSPASTTSNRLSSPIRSAKKQPGSVRMAREAMQSVRGGFNKPTAAAELKKAATSFSANSKVLPTSVINNRGGRHELSSDAADLSTRQSIVLQRQRSRSKSRYVLNKINGLLPGRRDKKNIAEPPVTSIGLDCMASKAGMTGPKQRPVPRLAGIPSMPKMPSLSQTILPNDVQSNRNEALVANSVDVENLAGQFDHQCHATLALAQNLVDNANSEPDPSRKEQLLIIAKVLNDSLISVREANISAETARQAATTAQISLEMTQQGVTTLHRLAAGLHRQILAGGRL